MSGSSEDDQKFLADTQREFFEKTAAPARSKVRFGAKPSGLHADNLSTKPAPGPKGGEAGDDIEWAKRRRRERAEAERGR